jgi:hypothetical protein
VAQERDEVAHRGEADAEHLRLGGLVPQLVDLERLERAALWHQADRAGIDELPFRARDLAPPVSFAIPHRQPRLGLVERSGRIAEPPHDQLGRTAGADMKFVPDTAGDRLAVFERDREIGAEPVIGARRARVPARPDDRMAAPQ